MVEPKHAPGPSHGFPANGKGFLFAPVLWFVYFITLYVVQGAGCAAGLDSSELMGTSTLRFVLVAVTLVAAATMVVVGVWSFFIWNRVRGYGKDSGGAGVDQSIFLAYGTMLHTALFLVATVWIGLPILIADLCNP